MAQVVLVPCECERRKNIDPSIMLTDAMTRFLSVAACVSIPFLLAGCAGTAKPLMPTPTLYHEPPVKVVFEDVPPARRRPRVELFCVTDRVPWVSAETKPPYGENRARSLAFGNAVVEMVPALA